MRPRFGELKESRVNKIVWPLAKTRDLNHRARFVLSPALPNPFKEKNFYNQSCTHGSISLVAWKAVNNLHSVSVDNSRLIPLPYPYKRTALNFTNFGWDMLHWRGQRVCGKMHVWCLLLIHAACVWNYCPRAKSVWACAWERERKGWGKCQTLYLYSTIILLMTVWSAVWSGTKGFIITYWN